MLLAQRPTPGPESRCYQDKIRTTETNPLTGNPDDLATFPEHAVCHEDGSNLLISKGPTMEAGTI